MPELKASEALAQHRNLIFRAALEKLKANELLNDAEVLEVQRREADEQKRKETAQKETRGRPSKLNAETIKKICAEVSIGATYTQACTLVGIKKGTFSTWQALAEEKGGLYSDLIEQLDIAKEKYLQKQRQNLNKAGEDGSWQASLQILERKDPDNWARKDQLRFKGEISGPNGIQLNSTTVVMVHMPSNGFELPEPVESTPEQNRIELNGNGQH